VWGGGRATGWRRPLVTSLVGGRVEWQWLTERCRRRSWRRRRVGRYVGWQVRRCWWSVQQRLVLVACRYTHTHIPDSSQVNYNYNEKSAQEETQTLRAGCSKAEPKIFAPPQTPFPGAQDGHNLISWRWSLPSPTNPVWWGSMHAISSYRGNTATYTPTHRYGRLQYTAPQLALCNYTKPNPTELGTINYWLNYTELHTASSRRFISSTTKLLMTISLSLSLSLRFNGHIPGGPGSAGTRMSPFWTLLELRMMEVVSGDN